MKGKVRLENEVAISWIVNVVGGGATGGRGSDFRGRGAPFSTPPARKQTSQVSSPGSMGAYRAKPLATPPTQKYPLFRGRYCIFVGGFWVFGDWVRRIVGCEIGDDGVIASPPPHFLPFPLLPLDSATFVLDLHYSDVVLWCDLWIVSVFAQTDLIPRCASKLDRQARALTGRQR